MESGRRASIDCVFELAGDTLTIWGGHRGSDNRYVGRFGADGATLDGAWSWSGGGYATTSARQPDARSADAFANG